MATFALGTAPALFAVAGAPTLFKGPKKVAMLRALGVIVVGFAVINATSASMDGDAPAIATTVVNGHTICYDMAYSKEKTPFVRWAESHGCAHALQGWGMLVEQAAESFTVWRGVRPDTKPVLQALIAS